jgi:hypothetical protein
MTCRDACADFHSPSRVELGLDHTDLDLRVAMDTDGDSNLPLAELPFRLEVTRASVYK